MKKSDTWIKKRHNFYRGLIRLLLSGVFRFKYNLKIKDKLDKKQQYLILCNHQTNLDPFMLIKAYKSKVYPVGTDDVMSKGNLSKFIKHAINPIPIRKLSNDVGAIMTMKTVVNEGGSIIIFPEGNRTYSGTTQSMIGSMSKFIKFLGLPVALFNIQGGYSIAPRWGIKKRKGHTTLSLRKLITPEEYKNMSSEELDRLVEESLYVSDYDSPNIKGKHLAEGIERVVYRCPNCGVTHFVSKGDTFKCESCSLEGTFNKDQSLTLKNSPIELHTLKDWYDYQEDVMASLDYESLSNDKIIEDKQCSLHESIRLKGKILILDSKETALYKDKIVIGDKIFEFSKIASMSAVLAHKLEFTIDEHTYQISGDEGYNAIKYLHFYYKFKNHLKGDQHVKFFGL